MRPLVYMTLSLFELYEEYVTSFTMPSAHGFAAFVGNDLWSGDSTKTHWQYMLPISLASAILTLIFNEGSREASDLDGMG
jgi:hypothetical protein